MPAVGQAAPELVGVAIGGAPFDLALLRPHPVIVEFFRGTW